MCASTLTQCELHVLDLHVHDVTLACWSNVHASVAVFKCLNWFEYSANKIYLREGIWQTFSSHSFVNEQCSRLSYYRISSHFYPRDKNNKKKLRINSHERRTGTRISLGMLKLNEINGFQTNVAWAHDKTKSLRSILMGWCHLTFNNVRQLREWRQLLAHDNIFG